MRADRRIKLHARVRHREFAEVAHQPGGIGRLRIELLARLREDFRRERGAERVAAKIARLTAATRAGFPAADERQRREPVEFALPEPDHRIGDRVGLRAG